MAAKVNLDVQKPVEQNVDKFLLETSVSAGVGGVPSSIEAAPVVRNEEVYVEQRATDEWPDTKFHVPVAEGEVFSTNLKTNAKIRPWLQ